MADNPTKRGRRADRVRINLGEPYEVTYWCKEFGCTAPELEEAVKTVGIMAEDVRTFIGARKTIAGG